MTAKDYQALTLEDKHIGKKTPLYDFKDYKKGRKRFKGNPKGIQENNPKKGGKKKELPRLC